MNKEQKKYIRKLSSDYGVSEEVVEAVVKSIYEYIRYNSKNMTSVRIPNFGLFVVKPNRVKHLNERKKRSKKKSKISKGDNN